MLSLKNFAFTLLIMTLVSSSSLAKMHDIRIIKLSGLIVDATTMQPLKSAKIIGPNGNVIGQTDDMGYYNVKLDYDTPGEIIFKYKIVKDGYKEIVQKEKWGDLNGSIKNTMFFGLSKKSLAESFSTLSQNSGTSYPEVLKIFENEIVPNKRLNDKIEVFKKENNGSLFENDGNLYLVNNTGWIALKSRNDLISIDRKKMVPAYKLDGVIKRKQIKWMTPLDDGDEAKFAIYTKK